MIQETTEQKSLYYVHYRDPLVVKKSFEQIISYFPKEIPNVIVLCIGTDRSTGDSLGPLTGTFLSKFRPKNIHLYGTLHEPVHAVNLEDYLEHIKQSYNHTFTIAVDASLGRKSSIGNIISGIGPITPGAALNKKLPPVGDIHLTGVVNIGGLMDYTILQSTRLSVVHDMAYKLSLILYRLDNWLTQHKTS